MASAYPSNPATPPLATPRTSDESTFRIGAALVLVAAAILYFARLGARALWSSEFRWAEIAREMLLTRNYFWPTINGHVYYDKPLGSYWLVTLSTPFTGGMNETAARLPCAIAGLLAVAFLMLLVRRLYDSRTAILSGFILATSFSFVFFSRHASADVETLTGELAALVLFERYENRAGGPWVIGLWLIMAATSLTKGLLGFALPILVIGAFSCLKDGWRGLADGIGRGALRERWRWLVSHNLWFFNWYSVPAIVLGIAVYAAPFEISNRLMGSEKGLAMVYRENVVRFFHPFDHRGPIYLYVYVIFALMAPWSAMLPAALVETHQRRRLHDEPARSDRFALVYFWATFLFFTLSGSRRSYYILPILPAAAILVARTLVFSADLCSTFAGRLLKLGYAVIAIAAVFGIAMLIPASLILPGKLAQFPSMPDKFVFLVFWILSVTGVFYAVRKFSPARAALSMGIIAYGLLAYIYIFAMPAAESYRGEKRFARATIEKTGNRVDQIAMFRTQGPLFYLDPPKPTPWFQKKQDLLDAINRGEVRWFIARQRDIPQLGLPTTLEVSEATYPWETEYNLRNKIQLMRVEGGGTPPPAQ
ncbi:MAG: glycosyltransferase family 39 protein [Candidatus Binatus sp.]|uniref:ArnT family glycosyltransferase n=1 Tax=Candidatus Binatus sp. TaxID=2811406 RepID=UPI00271E9645|nr:glycosyltransferase family 39 protein [Candidatus Binatus sp.]MDO8431947.1 glycosyltransferase family 39 protein [Candidatus Binatus sp.]